MTRRVGCATSGPVRAVDIDRGTSRFRYRCSAVIGNPPWWMPVGNLAVAVFLEDPGVAVWVGDDSQGDAARRPRRPVAEPGADL